MKLSDGSFQSFEVINVVFSQVHFKMTLIFGSFSINEYSCHFVNGAHHIFGVCLKYMIIYLVLDFWSLLWTWGTTLTSSGVIEDDTPSHSCTTLPLQFCTQKMLSLLNSELRDGRLCPSCYQSSTLWGSSIELHQSFHGLHGGRCQTAGVVFISPPAGMFYMWLQCLTLNLKPSFKALADPLWLLSSVVVILTRNRLI